MGVNTAQEKRQAVLARLEQQAEWDVIVIGGGIVGAAVALEAVQNGQQVLLLEQRDFAWGTSSRSSKMVHGGLRYLAEGDFHLTRDSVRERQRLLSSAPGLIKPLRYWFAHSRGQFPGPGIFGLLMTIYDFFAGKRDHQRREVSSLAQLAPHWQTSGLRAATQYTDAITDDARLVLRLLWQARELGATVVNYTKVTGLMTDQQRVCGVMALPQEGKQPLALRSRVVVNATGVWVDELKDSVNPGAQIRPLRGSHLVLPFWQLPVAHSITFFHPDDKRPVYVYPWEGRTVVGTTDLDHDQPLDQEPRISQQELDYLLKAVNSQFSRQVTPGDIIATFAGVRSVVSSGNALKPSQEKREHSVWDDNGLISVTGGKLTTFRLIAQDVLKRAQRYLPALRLDDRKSGFTTVPEQSLNQLRLRFGFDKAQRLAGRYGPVVNRYLAASAPELEPALLERIPGTDTLWLELLWAAEDEAVCHLEDLLLRRTRLGILMPEGGKALLPHIKRLCLPALGWDEARWRQEEQDYLALWQRYYNLPETEVTVENPVPDSAEVAHG